MKPPEYKGHRGFRCACGSLATHTAISRHPEGFDATIGLRVGHLQDQPICVSCFDRVMNESRVYKIEPYEEWKAYVMKKAKHDLGVAKRKLHKDQGQLDVA